jgi:hypothetical protein
MTKKWIGGIYRAMYEPHGSQGSLAWAGDRSQIFLFIDRQAVVTEVFFFCTDFGTISPAVGAKHAASRLSQRGNGMRKPWKASDAPLHRNESGMKMALAGMARRLPDATPRKTPDARHRDRP